MGHSVRLDNPTIVVKAIASFVLGGLAIGAGLMAVRLGFRATLVVMLAPSLLSILLGRLAQWEVRRSNGRVQGSGLAGWGICLSVLGLCSSYSHPKRATAEGLAREQAANNLKQIGLALSNYRQDHGRFPPAVVYSPDCRPLYSWRVLILPYLEQKALYDKFDLNEPWDSPHNHELLAQRPSVYDPVGIDVAQYPDLLPGVHRCRDGI